MQCTNHLYSEVKHIPYKLRYSRAIELSRARSLLSPVLGNLQDRVSSGVKVGEASGFAVFWWSCLLFAPQILKDLAAESQDLGLGLSLIL